MQSRAITGRMNYETNEVDAIIRTGCCHKLEGRSTKKNKNKIRNNLLKTENPTSNRLKTNWSATWSNRIHSIHPHRISPPVGRNRVLKVTAEPL